MSDPLILEALQHLKAGGLRPSSEMEKAHQICQLHEGDSMFDWIHALVHRIEGDHSNADYWYRRAGKAKHPGALEEEWQIVRAAAESD